MTRDKKNTEQEIRKPEDEGTKIEEEGGRGRGRDMGLYSETLCSLPTTIFKGHGYD